MSLATGADRTLYFDFLPVKLPKLRGYAIRVQLYTVPGQVHYNSTRKLVLAGADGVVFVADSQADRAAANVESLDNLTENLIEQGLRLEQVPHAIQLNKRDVAGILPAAELAARLNQHRAPVFETIATTGRGVFDALKSITTLVLTDLRRRGLWDGGAEKKAAAAPKEFEKDKEGESITHKLQALSEAAEAVARLGEPAPSPAPADSRPPSTSTGTSGLLPLHPRPAVTGPQLSELLPHGPAREAVITVETEIAAGDFARAIRLAARAFSDAASHTATAGGEDQPVLHALLLGLPGERYLRFREVVRRSEAGADSSADALYALFFLVDAVLRK